MIAPGPILQSDETPPEWGWRHYFATTFAAAVVAAVGTKLGEWAVEKLRAKLEKPKDGAP